MADPQEEDRTKAWYRLLRLPYPVAEHIVCGNVIVVRLEVPIGEVFNENVFGVTWAGDCVWQIEPRPYLQAKSPYTRIGLEGNAVVLVNWTGKTLLVDPATGAILEERYER